MEQPYTTVMASGSAVGNTTLTPYNYNAAASGTVLTSSADGLAPKWPSIDSSGNMKLTILNVGSGTFTFDANAKQVSFIVYAGGSGGGSGARGVDDNLGGGKGGGYGDWFYCFDPSVDVFGGAGSSLTYQVGAGGLGGEAVRSDHTMGNPGQAGGISRFGDYSAGYNTAGAGGTGFDGNGNGTDGVGGNSMGMYFCGGTSSVSTSDVFSNVLDAGVPGFYFLGGAGGAGGTCDHKDGSNGFFPAGAGGAGASCANGVQSGAGGRGADGVIYVVEYL